MSAGQRVIDGMTAIQMGAPQTALGVTLIGTTFWADAISAVSTGLSLIATLCGAIIGIHGVYRIIRNWRRKLPDRDEDQT